jgi:hypothetical protein
MGSGNTCPDATGVGTATPSVRRERSGNLNLTGEGRVYHVNITGRDPLGAACSAAVVTVCVPHDQSPGATCADQGPLYDSTSCP